LSILTSGIVIVAVVLGGLFVLVYNNLIRLRNNVNKAWANVDVLLQKRHDLIGNLLNTVKGYMKYEKTVLVKVTAMRTAWANVQNDDSRDSKMAAANQISGSLKSLFADVEAYPDLKADSSFITLQQELVQIEDEIADRREFYNDTVNEYNINIKIIPYDFFAGLLGYRQMQFFQVPDSEKKPVSVKI
jgi:LemA protein